MNWQPAQAGDVGRAALDAHLFRRAGADPRPLVFLDNDSTSRNFDTIGQRPYLYFTRFNVGFDSPASCFTSLDRDLIRIPVEFSNQQPGGPSAMLAASQVSPRTGELVQFRRLGLP